MISVDLKSLVSRLNDPCRSALEAAAGLCLSRTNFNLEIEHWLLKLIEPSNTDIDLILRHYDVNLAALQRDLTKAIDKLKTGNTRPPVLNPDTVELARDAWLIGSIDFGAPRTRSGHILCSLLADESRGRLAREASQELAKLSGEELRRNFAKLTANSSEEETVATAAAAGAAATQDAAGGRVAGGPSKTPGLDQFTIDLTAQARAGKMDPVVGRDTEVRQIIDILMRRRQNNPILTGEAGVGKTAVVEGLAQRIAEGDVPPSLRDVVLRSLDLGLLQSGASIKGEFENRLRKVIDEVKAAPQPIILFIDEAHMLIGAGGAAGQGDAANLLKPALARGELRTIAATTWSEYKKYFEKDPALSRRFQVVKVEEPAEEVAMQMMRGLVDTLERHHGVRLLDEAVVDSVTLAKRYISGRQLPDKSVSLLDTACARVAIARSDTPPAIEGYRRRLHHLAVRTDILNREHAAGGEHQAELDKLQAEKTEAEVALKALEERWSKEREVVEQILDTRIQLETGHALPPKDAKADGKQPAEGKDKPATNGKAGKGKQPPMGEKLSDAQLAELKSTFERLRSELAELQGDEPLLSPWVDRQAIAAVVSNWTGIPVGRMVADQIETVLKLGEKMGERVVGQSHALDIIAQRIRTSRADLTDPNKPIGVFFLPGPSGVGKTETALTLADLLYGGEQSLTVINMSEFKEEHKVSLLMGSPPGYVGYGEGGVLTEAVRRKPYSVVLLDEMEKAHPGVQDVFYQVFDKGSLRDGEGRDIDFRNTVIIMTSNAASDLIAKLCVDPDTRPEHDALAKAIHPELLKSFKPAFLGRCTIVPYFPLGDDVLRQIIHLKLAKIVRRVRDNYGATVEYTPEVVETIASRCTEVESGARNVDNIVSQTLLPALSSEFLAAMVDERKFQTVRIGVENNGFKLEVA